MPIRKIKLEMVTVVWHYDAVKIGEEVAVDGWVNMQCKIFVYDYKYRVKTEKRKSQNRRTTKKTLTMPLKWCRRYQVTSVLVVQHREVEVPQWLF